MIEDIIKLFENDEEIPTYNQRRGAYVKEPLRAEERGPSCPFPSSLPSTART